MTWNRREITHESPDWLAENWHGRLVLPIEMTDEQFAVFWPLHVADLELTKADPEGLPREGRYQLPLIDRMYQQYHHLILDCDLWPKQAKRQETAVTTADLPLDQKRTTPALRAALVAMIHPLVMAALDLPKSPGPSTATTSETEPTPSPGP